MNEELRLYSFTNFYLSSIQQGIQPAHATVELFNKYYNRHGVINSEQDIKAGHMLDDWARNHKTMVCLNGGDNDSLKDIYKHLSDKDNPYPWAFFLESEPALGGIMTSLAIILPEQIYGAASQVRKGTATYDHVLDELRVTVKGNSGAPGDIKVIIFNRWEYQLIEIINSCSLSR